MAAADLDGNGSIETVVTTTNTVDDWLAGVRIQRVRRRVSPGRRRRPRGLATTPGTGCSTESGTTGTGRTGRTSGIGNLDDDPQLEIVVTFDNHQINVFNHDGTSVLASAVVHEPRADARGAPWLGAIHPLAEPAGRGSPLPPPRGAMAGRPQDTLASVDGVAADRRRPRPRWAKRGDRHTERGARHSLQNHAPTRSWRSTAPSAAGRGRRAGTAASATPPLSRRPAFRPNGDWYPPVGIPAPTVVEHRPATAAPRSWPLCPTASSTRWGRRAVKLWRYDYARGRAKTFASEVVAADLNRDGRPELVFGTYGPQRGAGRLVVLSGRRPADLRQAPARPGHRTATASALPRRRRSPIWTETGGSRSWCQHSITGSTSTASRDPGTNKLPWPTGSRQPAAQRRRPGDGSVATRLSETGHEFLIRS